MSEEMIALLITVAVVVALVLWIPSLHIIGRAAKHARASPQAGKSQLKQEAESTGSGERHTRNGRKRLSF